MYHAKQGVLEELFTKRDFNQMAFQTKTPLLGFR